MTQKQHVLESPIQSNPNELHEEVENQQSKFEGEAKPRRTLRREWHAPSNSKNFRVDISEFEGKLKFDEFLEWYTLLNESLSTKMY